ncbi:MAG: DUF5618 family protein [Bacteroidales bacterium]|nr:DUF5618 family protein [Bacteroidales bacterium]
MKITDNKRLKEASVKEAKRHLMNAKTMLSEKAGKKDKFYTDAKYVKTACGIAYIGVLIIIDAYIKIKGEKLSLKNTKRKSIDYYRQNLINRDKILLNLLNNAYNVLHLNGYYEGELKVSTINDGLRTLQEIITHFNKRC